MKTNLILAAAILFCTAAAAQPSSYDAATIPDSLRKNAHTVKRFENIALEVTDIDRASYSVHQVLTVLSEEGESSLMFQTSTSRQYSLDEVDIRTYDAAGNLRGKFRKKDLKQQGSMEGLVDDGMYYYLPLSTRTYPMTVEFAYRIKITGTLQYPSYDIAGPGEAVQQSSFTAKVPAELGLRYMKQKTTLEPAISESGPYRIYTWQANNVAAFAAEEGASAARFRFPSIILAPNKFRHFNTVGDLSSWSSFGAWGYALTKGLDELPAERRQFFSLLVSGAHTDREKAELLYEYLQKNFRYVSIQLGIGGVKPFPAKSTDEKKYGDCKGLSFFMYAALKAVGVRSHLALINASYNQESVDPAFPCDRFNHMILCIPAPKDSIWLECTSSTNEFGVLGTFTENRNALLLTEQGGVLVSTPTSKASSNSLLTVTDITLHEDGSGDVKAVLRYNGEYKEALRQMHMAKKDDQKLWLMHYLGFRQPDEFSLEAEASDHQGITEVTMSMEKVPQFTTGGKMFMNPRIMTINSQRLPKAEQRKQDYYFQYPYDKTDTTIYHLPEGYVVDALPKEKTLEGPNAYYSTKFYGEAGKIFSVTRLTLKSHRVPVQSYAEVKHFFDAVVSDENQKIVIKKS